MPRGTLVASLSFTERLNVRFSDSTIKSQSVWGARGERGAAALKALRSAPESTEIRRDQRCASWTEAADAPGSTPLHPFPGLLLGAWRVASVGGGAVAQRDMQTVWVCCPDGFFAGASAKCMTGQTDIVFRKHSNSFWLFFLHSNITEMSKFSSFLPVRTQVIKHFYSCVENDCSLAISYL